MENSVTISGTIKNIRAYSNDRGTMMTGWLNQRDVSRTSNGDADRMVYIAGIKIVSFAGDVAKDLTSLDSARQGQEETQLVTLTGRLVTKFDRRQNVAEGDKRAPELQLEVYAVEVK